jgi:hypothetical protein
MIAERSNIVANAIEDALVELKRTHAYAYTGSVAICHGMSGRKHARRRSTGHVDNVDYRGSALCGCWC